MLKRDNFFLTLLTIFSTVLVWLAFPLLYLFGIGKGIFTVFANFDGPNYIVIAKTFYNQSLIAASFSQPPPLNYYPAHLPAYPLLIRLFSFFLPYFFNYLAEPKNKDNLTDSLANLANTGFALWAFLFLR